MSLVVAGNLAVSSDSGSWVFDIADANTARVPD